MPNQPDPGESKAANNSADRNDSAAAERLLAQALRAQVRSVSAPRQPPARSESSAELAKDPGALPDFLATKATTETTTETSGTRAHQDKDLAHAELPPRYGLLSGADASSLERERAALGDEPGHSISQSPAPMAVASDEPRDVPSSISAWWVLILAVVLGLAAGSVMGLLTLL